MVVCFTRTLLHFIHTGHQAFVVVANWCQACAGNLQQDYLSAYKTLLLTKKLMSRQEQEASLTTDERSLVTLLKAQEQSCTDMLRSEDRGLSLAASAKMLLYRARCWLQQREPSLALTDLAYAFSLTPCSEEVMQLKAWP